MNISVALLTGFAMPTVSDFPSLLHAAHILRNVTDIQRMWQHLTRNILLGVLAFSVRILYKYNLLADDDYVLVF